MVEIRPTLFEYLESDPAFPRLLQAYAEESQLQGLPPADIQSELYRRMEATGAFHVLGAFKDDELIGFLSFLVTVLPHYGALVATTESIFVAAEHRSTGAGTRLLREMERQCARMGAVGMLVAAPHGSRLANAMPWLAYKQTHSVFFKSLKENVQ